MQSIDGRKLALQIRHELKKEISASGLRPKLGVLLVGDDPASHLYVALKEKAAAEVGIETDVRRLSTSVSDKTIKDIIQAWNEDISVHGILIQLPLPDGYDTDGIIETMNPKKDADGFHPKNSQALLAGVGTIIPPLHEGILRLIAESNLRLNGTRAVIISNGKIFSEPLAHLLRIGGAFVEIFGPQDIDRKTLLLAKIVVIAVGQAKFLTRGMIGRDTCVIDVGTNKLSNGEIVGDVDAEALMNLEGWLSPVPGGVGPMTIAMLLKNVFFLAKQQIT